MSIIQLWEIISVDTSVQRDLERLGIDCGKLKTFRNWLAHCNTFDYEELEEIFGVIKSEKMDSYILEKLHDGIHEYFKDSVMAGAYNARISEQM